MYGDKLTLSDLDSEAEGHHHGHKVRRHRRGHHRSNRVRSHERGHHPSDNARGHERGLNLSEKVREHERGHHPNDNDSGHQRGHHPSEKVRGHESGHHPNDNARGHERGHHLMDRVRGHERGHYLSDRVRGHERVHHLNDNARGHERGHNLSDRDRGNERGHHHSDRVRGHERGDHSNDRVRDHERGHHSNDRVRGHEREHHSNDRVRGHERDHRSNDRVRGHERDHRSNDRVRDHERGHRSNDRVIDKEKEFLYNGQNIRGQRNNANIDSENEDHQHIDRVRDHSNKKRNKKTIGNDDESNQGRTIDQRLNVDKHGKKAYGVKDSNTNFETKREQDQEHNYEEETGGNKERRRAGINTDDEYMETDLLDQTSKHPRLRKTKDTQKKKRLKNNERCDEEQTGSFTDKEDSGNNVQASLDNTTSGIKPNRKKYRRKHKSRKLKKHRSKSEEESKGNRVDTDESDTDSDESSRSSDSVVFYAHVGSFKHGYVRGRKTNNQPLPIARIGTSSSLKDSEFSMEENRKIHPKSAEMSLRSYDYGRMYSRTLTPISSSRMSLPGYSSTKLGGKRSVDEIERLSSQESQYSGKGHSKRDQRSKSDLDLNSISAIKEYQKRYRKTMNGSSHRPSFSSLKDNNFDLEENEQEDRMMKQDLKEYSEDDDEENRNPTISVNVRQTFKYENQSGQDSISKSSTEALRKKHNVKRHVPVVDRKRDEILIGFENYLKSQKHEDINKDKEQKLERQEESTKSKDEEITNKFEEYLLKLEENDIKGEHSGLTRRYSNEKQDSQPECINQIKNKALYLQNTGRSSLSDSLNTSSTVEDNKITIHLQTDSFRVMSPPPHIPDETDFDSGRMTSPEPDLELVFDDVIDVEELEGIDAIEIIDPEEYEKKMQEERERKKRHRQKRKMKKMKADKDAKRTDGDEEVHDEEDIGNDDDADEMKPRGHTDIDNVVDYNDFGKQSKGGVDKLGGRKGKSKNKNVDQSESEPVEGLDQDAKTDIIGLEAEQSTLSGRHENQNKPSESRKGRSRKRQVKKAGKEKKLDKSDTEKSRDRQNDDLDIVRKENNQSVNSVSKAKGNKKNKKSRSKNRKAPVRDKRRPSLVGIKLYDMEKAETAQSLLELSESEQELENLPSIKNQLAKLLGPKKEEPIMVSSSEDEENEFDETGLLDQNDENDIRYAGDDDSDIKTNRIETTAHHDQQDVDESLARPISARLEDILAKGMSGRRRYRSMSLPLQSDIEKLMKNMNEAAVEDLRKPLRIPVYLPAFPRRRIILNKQFKLSRFLLQE